MKTHALLFALALLLCGCRRNAELAEARENLAEAQRKIAAIEAEQISRIDYERTRASLQSADEHIAVLERTLKLRQEQLAVQDRTRQQTVQPPTTEATAKPIEIPTTLTLLKGVYETTNDTHVYSHDAQLNFGEHLQISSPTGMMVSDSDQKIVAGDLSIKAKGMVLETSDGLFATAEDGSVKFVGKTLTMKFAGTVPAQEIPAAATPPSTPTKPVDANPTAAPTPAEATAPEQPKG